MREIVITHPKDSSITKKIAIGGKESGVINLHFSAWNYRFNYIETETTIILLRSARPFPYRFTIADCNNYYFEWVEIDVDIPVQLTQSNM